MMASSNDELLQRMKENAEGVNIENTEGQERVIAMVSETRLTLSTTCNLPCLPPRCCCVMLL